MDRGALQATVHGVAKSWTRLSDYLTTIVFRIYANYLALIYTNKTR